LAAWKKFAKINLFINKEMLQKASQPTPNINPLTPNISLGYANVTLMSSKEEDEKNMGYLVYQGRSKAKDEIHHIRALNHGSDFAKKSINLAITLFLQETLRMCSLYPHCIILDTLEFHEKKICYAMKPLTSPVPELAKLDVSSLLKDLLTDLNYLTSKGGIDQLCISKSRIYQIQHTNSSLHGDHQLHNHRLPPFYFMQDWNKVIWTPILEGEAAAEKKMQQKERKIN